MKIILREDIPSLGTAGTTKEVKNGFANNYLIPHRLAYPATERYLKIFENEKKAYEKKKQKLLKEAEEMKLKIEGLSVSIPVKTGEEDKLYGSVTSQDIIEKAKEQGLNLSKKQIALDENIKKLGIYHVPVKLAPEISASLKVWIIKE